MKRSIKTFIKKFVVLQIVFNMLFGNTALLFAESLNRKRMALYTPRVAAEKVFSIELDVSPDEPASATVGNVRIELPEGAVDAPTTITVEQLSNVEKMNHDIINTTTDAKGYRFLPHGTQFLKPVLITLPYNRAIASTNEEVKNLYTYFYNERTMQWEQLERVSVNPEKGLITSATTHFTDMISGLVTVPDTPQPSNFDINSIKNLEAANPSTGINLITAPEANNMGSANLSYPLEFPTGREGMSPTLSINYTSTGTNGWMGLGWNIAFPSITVDTKSGVPRYSSDTETEKYLLNGNSLLASVGDTTDVPRVTGSRTYTKETEGSFERIIRHGNTPADYWWEVTTTKGTTYYYGATHDQVFDSESVLADNTKSGESFSAGKNIFTWPLRCVKDIHGNIMYYNYEKVSDSGTGDGEGSYKGTQIYLSSIVYTGKVSGTTLSEPGLYEIKFIRDRDFRTVDPADPDNQRRSDVIIDARPGFKTVTADLLKKIEVLYNGQEVQNNTVRSYEFTYKDGAFEKKLLENIIQYGADNTEFNRHTLEYYDKIGDKLGFGDSVTNPMPDDGIKIDYPVLDNLEISSEPLGSTFSFNKNFHLYTGYNPAGWTKMGSVGMKLGFSNADTKTLSALVDLDGDNIPDKVYSDLDPIGIIEIVKPTSTYFRKGIKDTDGTVYYAEPVTMGTFPGLNKQKSYSGTIGGEVYMYGANASLAASFTTTMTEIYFTDANGDGLMDVVKKGQVYFNYTQENGTPQFSTDSSLTAIPIVAGDPINQGALDNSLSDLYNDLDTDNPRVDVVRYWKAPYNGTVRITGNPTLEDPAGYKFADGVRVAIQHKSSELWSEDITSDMTGTPVAIANVDSVSVSKGDSIYFRVQSVDNGINDTVNWIPQIEYISNLGSDLIDENGMAADLYNSQTDFIMAGRTGNLTAAVDGQIEVSGTIDISSSTDAIKFIIKKEEYVENGTGPITTVFSHTFSAGAPASLTVNEVIDVNQMDQISVYFTSDSAIDIRNISFAPTYNLLIPGAQAQEISGFYDINFFPQLHTFRTVYDSSDNSYTTEKTNSVTTAPFKALKDGTIIVTFERPSTSYDTTFTVKSANTLVYKNKVDTTGSLEIPVLEDDELYFNFALKNPVDNEFSSSNGSSYKVKVEYKPEPSPSPAPTPMPSPTPTPTPIPDIPQYVPFKIYSKVMAEIPSLPFRGWGVFAYNGNRNKTTAMTESHLIIKRNQSDYENEEQPDAFILYPEQQTNRWMLAPETTDPNASPTGTVEKELILFSKTGDMASSRFAGGELPQHRKGDTSGTGVFTVDRIGNGTQVQASGGFGPANAGGAIGSSGNVVDYMDMNGDGYPDIVTEDFIQYTLPGGGFGSGISFSGSLSNFSDNENKSWNLGIGFSGNPAVAKPDAQGDVMATTGGEVGGIASQFGIGGSVGAGSSDAVVTLRDMNADGLPDKVKTDDDKIKVSLNLGYGFASYEEWGNDNIETGSSLVVAGNMSLSFNDGAYGYGGGLSYTYSDSEVTKIINDINGDGLQDILNVNDDGLLTVNLNRGGSFQRYNLWTTGNEYTNNSKSHTIGAGLYFTIPIALPPTFTHSIIINPGGDLSMSLGSVKSAFNDLNGDGLVDRLVTNGSGGLDVNFNDPGETNLLKKVTRPLGAIIDLEYSTQGNTYKMPQYKWVLSKVSVNDGFAGDGEDVQVKTYSYENGNYSRSEKEFLGFEKVITEKWNKNAAGYDMVDSGITTEYLNTETYNKGLVAKVTTEDNIGNIEDVTTNEYAFTTLSNSAVFPHKIQTESTSYENYQGNLTSIATKKEYQNFNAFGAPQLLIDHGSPGTSDDLIIKVNYMIDAGNYIVKADLIEVFQEYDSSANLKRRSEYDYDPLTGEVTKARQYYNYSDYAETEFSYDGYGNLINVINPPNANGERYAIAYEYDTQTHTYVTKMTDSFNYESTSTYDLKFGKETAATDINNQVMTNVYDEFGRLTDVFSPYSTVIPAVRYEYYHNELIPRAVTYNKSFFEDTDTQTIDTVIFIDGIGRVVQSKKEAEVRVAGDTTPRHGMTVSGKIQYDALSRTILKGMPVFVEGYDLSYASIPMKNPTEYQYSTKNRVEKTILPDGNYSLTYYTIEDDLYKTISVDLEGNTSYVYTNLRKKAAKKTEVHNGTEIVTTFEYSPFDELLQVTDAHGNVTSYEYDMKGRQLSIDSPNMGLVQHSYDKAGNKISTTDNKGQTTFSGYEYNRLITVDYPNDPDLTYYYGDANIGNNKVGRMIRSEDAAGYSEFEYGKLGETTKNTRLIEYLNMGNNVRLSESYYFYDYLGRINKIIYPDTEEVKYQYNEGGQVTTVTGKKIQDRTKPYDPQTNYYIHFEYIDDIHYNENGQRVYIKYVNDTETNYTYDPLRLWMTNIVTNKVSSNGNVESTLQNYSYTFDKVGNVTAYTNNNVNLDRSYIFNFNQSYQYDDLYRLTGSIGHAEKWWPGNPVITANNRADYDLTMNYDEIGNITYKALDSRIWDHEALLLNYEFNYSYDGSSSGLSLPNAPKRIDGWWYNNDGVQENICLINYDANGNLTSRDYYSWSVQSRSDFFEWNDRNKIENSGVDGKSSNYNPANMGTYIYGADGIRTNKMAHNSETLYVSRFIKYISVQIGFKHIFVGKQREITKKFTDNQGGIFDYNKELTDLYVFHKNYQGSTNVISFSTGDVYSYMVHMPYGEMFIKKEKPDAGQEDDKKNLVYRYKGEEYDEESRLINYGARYYDPRLSLWMSPDPAMYGTNWFRYCKNNPVNFIDPTGLAEEPVKSEEEQIKDNVKKIQTAMIEMQALEQHWDKKTTEAYIALSNAKIDAEYTSLKAAGKSTLEIGKALWKFKPLKDSVNKTLLKPVLNWGMGKLDDLRKNYPKTFWTGVGVLVAGAATTYVLGDDDAKTLVLQGTELVGANGPDIAKFQLRPPLMPKETGDESFHGARLSITGSYPLLQGRNNVKASYGAEGSYAAGSDSSSYGRVNLQGGIGYSNNIFSTGAKATVGFGSDSEVKFELSFKLNLGK